MYKLSIKKNAGCNIWVIFNYSPFFLQKGRFIRGYKIFICLAIQFDETANNRTLFVFQTKTKIWSNKKIFYHWIWFRIFQFVNWIGFWDEWMLPIIFEILLTIFPFSQKVDLLQGTKLLMLKCTNLWNCVQ